MLSYLDCLNFPDRCEVYEVVPSQRYVYPIFKNGSTSLRIQAYNSNWKIKINEQLQNLTNVDIIIRDPADRLVSGINTFVQHTLRDNPTLDEQTVIWFSKNYLYLNRHYNLQFSWIVNLARYINIDTKLNFLPVSAMSDFTLIDDKPSTLDVNFVHRLGDIPNQEMYQRLDSVLFRECIGKSLTFAELLNEINANDPVAYKFVIDRAKRILNPLYVLPKT